MGYTSIQIDFDEAYALAKRLEDCAEEMKRLAVQRMENALSEMAAGWKGESAAAYFAKAETTKEAIISTSEKLGSIASSIRRQAKRTYDAEMAALRLAEERTSGSGGGGGRAF